MTPAQYIAKAPVGSRATLEALRKRLRAAVPKAAEETISYGVPSFRVLGRALIGYGATGTHCAIYPMSGAIIAALASELSGYETSKGAIRFLPSKPPPVALLKRVIKARLAELALR